VIALILLSFIHVLEAWLEEMVIFLKNPTIKDYDKANHKEHFRSAVFSATLSAIAITYVIVHTTDYWLIPELVINRRIFFDYTDILIRKRPRFLYEGNDWWKGFFVKIFGKKGRTKELLLELAITIASIVLSIIY